MVRSRGPSRAGPVRYHGLDLIRHRVALERRFQSSDSARSGITSFRPRPCLRLAEELPKLVELSCGRRACTPEPVYPVEPIEDRLTLVHVLRP